MGRALIISGSAVLLLAAVCFVFLDAPVVREVYARRWINLAGPQYLTRLGISTWYLVGSFVLCVLLRFAGRRLWAWRCLFVFVSIAASGIAVILIKPIAARCRPMLLINQGAYGFRFFELSGYDLASFPSGHACTIGALCSALYLFFPRWGLPLIALAVAVAASRVLVLAHYPSDVLVGLYLGAVYTFGLERVFVWRGVAVRSSAAKFMAPRPLPSISA